jgi:hypothetical protein
MLFFYAAESILKMLYSTASWSSRSATYSSSPNGKSALSRIALLHCTQCASHSSHQSYTYFHLRSGNLVRLAKWFLHHLLVAYNQRIDSLQNAAAKAKLQARMEALTAEFERLYARLRFDMRIGQHHLRSAQYNRRMLVQDAEVCMCVYTL